MQTICRLAFFLIAVLFGGCAAMVAQDDTAQGTWSVTDTDTTASIASHVSSASTYRVGVNSGPNQHNVKVVVLDGEGNEIKAKTKIVEPGDSHDFDLAVDQSIEVHYLGQAQGGGNASGTYQKV